VTGVIDLFAGPGGWDQGLAMLGRRDVLGVEIDADACATAQAAGHARVQADVADLDPEAAAGGVEGIIASPPCQGFSSAGRRRGRADSDLLLAAVADLASGLAALDTLRHKVADSRSTLVLEPLRWVLAVRPEWTAWEQVPTVLPLWHESAIALRARRYSAWAGTVGAEQFGVPQTRTRAVLLARRHGALELPEPTHSRFYVREPDRLDPGVRPWVSMSQALGWDGADLIGFPRLADKHATITIGGAAYRARDLRLGAMPAWTLTEKARSWSRWHSPSGRVWSEDAQRHRVLITEASALQTFPPDYPWIGSHTSRFLQLGNAVPPHLAAHLLRPLAAATAVEEAA
jgi:DNA (cytosine-5)-methyltransferase 1